MSAGEDRYEAAEEFQLMFILFCVQDALSAEINNLGGNYGNDSAASGNEQRNNWGQTFVDREQFLRWGTFEESLLVCCPVSQRGHATLKGSFYGTLRRFAMTRTCSVSRMKTFYFIKWRKMNIKKKNVKETFLYAIFLHLIVKTFHKKTAITVTTCVL